MKKNIKMGKINKESKTKIAVFGFTGCEECEFNFLSLNEKLLDLFQDFEITNWKLLSDERRADFDIALIEGAITTEEQARLLKKIRKTAKIVIAIGACAITGNIFALLTAKKRRELSKRIYNKDYKLKGKFLKPVSDFIKVDKDIPGCPFDVEQLQEFLKSLKNEKVESRREEVVSPDFVAKIEGHGTLLIDFKKKKVDFKVEESERLVEGLLLGKDFKQAPFVVSRICGICPTAHNICSLSAIEDALKIKISEETKILRKILLAGQVIKSHLLHLFFLVLPDYAGLKKSIDLSVKYPAEFHAMLVIKRLADELLEIISGSSAFPAYSAIDGFNVLPKMEKLEAVKDSISDVTDESYDLIKLFSQISKEYPELETKTELACTIPEDSCYPSYPGNFLKEIKEIVQKEPAKLGVLENGSVIKVGALSRLNNYSGNLNLKARKVFQNLRPNLKNPFNNNLAQAIEILHFLEEIERLLILLKKGKIENAQARKLTLPPTGNSIGRAWIEAPRGMLFHEVEINPAGEIVNYNIIPPTQLNLASLEKEAQELIEKMAGLPHEEQKKEVEKLIRAFDPCITCAVH